MERSWNELNTNIQYCTFVEQLFLPKIIFMKNAEKYYKQIKSFSPMQMNAQRYWSILGTISWKVNLNKFWAGFQKSRV